MVIGGRLSLILLSSVPSCVTYVGPQWLEGILSRTEAKSSPQVLCYPLTTILLGRCYDHFPCADEEAGSLTLNNDHLSNAQAEPSLEPGQAHLEMEAEMEPALQKCHMD